LQTFDRRTKLCRTNYFNLKKQVKRKKNQEHGIFLPKEVEKKQCEVGKMKKKKK